MQPISREMQGINSLINSSQISLQDLNNQIQNPHMNINHNQQLNPFDPTSHDDFLQQMLSNLDSSSSWLDHDTNINNKPMLWEHKHDETTLSNMENNVVGFPYDNEHVGLASKFRNHQINATSPTNKAAAAAALLLHHQLLMARGVAADSGLPQMPVSLGGNDVVDGSSFKSPNLSAENSLQAMHNGFAGSLHGTVQASNQTQHFQPPQGATINQAAPTNGAVGGTQGQPRQRVRARRGQATDPHSIAERLRRERIAERMKALQELVPNANKTDKASMLDEIIDYVKFLQLQVKVLSMSRLGGAGSFTPCVSDMPSKGGGDCIQTNGSGALQRYTNGNQTAASTSNNESLTMSEHQVAKLMEEDMGSAMQYLQGKGLCLMPISLATAISTCHTRNNNHLTNGVHNGSAGVNLNLTNGEGPSSSSVSVTTVQSAAVANVNAVRDAASVSKP
ncbi:hypothetical protein Lal_00026183 [Lupinus albus]|uniref:Putative transcription factor bHLH family n=1 Tax=Lupinus albus TaxID=3870 RepID=A0A6A5MCG9_LUPAL|nr:putative transcription factor bHLH family [Lupinus albus]KAF1870669.1 hypothetical protein Lal_00026183 [Lupinus albus]